MLGSRLETPVYNDLFGNKKEKMTTRSSKRKHEASPDEKGKGKAKEFEKEPHHWAAWCAVEASVGPVTLLGYARRLHRAHLAKMAEPVP